MIVTNSVITRIIEEDGIVELIDIYSKKGKRWLQVKCQCSEVFDVLWDHYKRLNKKKCNACNGKRRLSLEDVRKEAAKGGCELLSQEYRTATHKLVFKCCCGEKFLTTLKIFRKGKNKCSNCVNKRLSKRFSKSEEVFSASLNEMHNGEIYISGDFINMNTKVNVTHSKCGISWDANPGDILYNKSGCPSCASSKGEIKIRLWLDSARLSYKEQFRLDNCRNQRPLPFDFALFRNGNLVALIEYDGIQHFDNRCFGGKSYETTVKNDEIKNEYCKENNIPLIRIPYYELENIEHILKEKICTLIPSQAG